MTHPAIAGIPLVLGGNVFGMTADQDASFAVLDAFDAEQRVGDFADGGALAPRHEHLKAMVMVQVHMHPGHDVALKLMLNVGQLSGEIRHVVVIDEGNRRHRVLILVPLLTNQAVTNEVANGLGTICV